MTAQHDPLLLSGLQHFAFCRRQWALIHIEQQWQENVRTVEGTLMHRNAHRENSFEMREGVLVARGLRIRSERLNVTGSCDVVEFHPDPAGICLPGRPGLWQPYPVEYKRGSPKVNEADELQLCAQAICLEEMLLCTIPEGSLFYGETRRRHQVTFTEELRGRVESLLAEMQSYMERGHTPRVKPTKGCNACSLKEICLPGLERAGSAARYLKNALQET